MNTTKHDRPGAAAGQVDCRVRPLADALDSLCRQLAERAADDADTPLLLTVARATALVNALADAPSAIMDTRTELAVCAEREEDFPALYALQGRRVLLLDLGPNVRVQAGQTAREGVCK